MVRDTSSKRFNKLRCSRFIEESGVSLPFWDPSCGVGQRYTIYLLIYYMLCVICPCSSRKATTTSAIDKTTALIK